MEIDEQNSNNKTKFKKRAIIILAIIIVVLGIGIAIFFAILGTPKTTYFLAEKKTIDFVVKEINERFEPELKWVEYTQKNAIASEYKLSGKYNDPAENDKFELFNLEDIISNSSLSLKTETDMNNKKIAFEVIAKVIGVEVDNINMYLTDEKLMLRLPFINDTLLIQNEDLNSVAHKIDPQIDTIDLDLADFFENESPILTDKDIKYFQKEYLLMIHNDLSGDSFTSDNEKIDLNGETLKTKKVKMILTEKELKEISSKVLQKLGNDERIIEIIKEQIEVNNDQIIIDYKNTLLKLEEEINSLSIPEGITSTVWINEKIIVKRDFSMDISISQNNVVSVQIVGEQLLKNKNQKFSYDFMVEDDFDTEILSILGDLSWVDDKVKDSIIISFNDMELSYTSNESLNKEQREFTRSFSLIDPYGTSGSILWNGESSYEKDLMSSEHRFSLDTLDADNLFELRIGIDGRKIKELKTFDEEKIVNIGKMTEQELMNYIENDVATQFQLWVIKLLGAGALGF